MRYLLILIAIIVSLSFINANAQQYLCVGDMSTGFKFNEKINDWEYARFSTDKYMISRNIETNELRIKIIGSDSYEALNCKTPVRDYTRCTDAGGLKAFKVDFKNNKFMYVYSAGYLFGKETPSIEIGKCSKID
jgi:hypothetical protein